MNKTLINNNGHIYYVWIVENFNELNHFMMDIGIKSITQRMISFAKNPEKDLIMGQFHEMSGLGLIHLSNKLILEIKEGATKLLEEGEILVFNQSCGYCTLDFQKMKVLHWKNLLEIKDTVILENANELDIEVINYLKINSIKDYLSITSLFQYTNEELLYYLRNAKTIVFKTQSSNTKQLESLMALSSILESKKIVLVNSPNFPAERVELKHHLIERFKF